MLCVKVEGRYTMYLLVFRQLILLGCILFAVPALIQARIGIAARFSDDVILENLKIGKSYNLRTMGKLPYKVINAGDAIVGVAIEIEISKENQLKPGYEPLPDPSWIKIVPDTFRLGPGESGISEIIITIPDKPEYVNRNFQTEIYAHTTGTGFMAAGARHRIRFSTGKGPETLLAEKKRKAMFELNLDFKPMSVYLVDVKPGVRYNAKKMRKSLKLINWADNQIKIKLKSILYSREFSLPSGYVPAPDPSWLTVKPGEVKIAGNEIKELKIFVNIPDEEEYYGKKYAFLVKAELIGVDVLLELYARVYVTTKGYEKK